MILKIYQLKDDKHENSMLTLLFILPRVPMLNPHALHFGPINMQIFNILASSTFGPIKLSAGKIVKRCMLRYDQIILF